MSRTRSLAASLWIAAATEALATVSFDVAVDRLNDASGAAAPSASLVFLVADTQGDGLGTARAGAIGVGVRLDGETGDDLVVHAADLSVLGVSGALALSTGALDFQMDGSGRWGAGDPLFLVWFPGLDLSDGQLPAGTAYGSLALGLTPGDGSMEALNYVSPGNSGTFGNDPVPGSATNTLADSLSIGADIPPALTTLEALQITETTATLAGEVTDEGDFPVVERGVVWSIQPDPTLSNGSFLPAAGGGAGSFSVPVGGLVPGTTYHFKAYASNAGGTGYGGGRYFTTDETLALVEGVASSTRSILPGDVHRFRFNLGAATAVDLGTSGAASLLARLFDGTGQIVAEQTVAGAVAFANLSLGAGDYLLELRRDPGAGGADAYTLDLDTTVDDFALVDAAAGASLPATVGLGLYSPVLQQVTLRSPSGRKVSAYATMGNEGSVRDRFDVSGTRGTSEFSVSYFDGLGNVTAAVVAGTYATAEADPGETTGWIRVDVTPTKRAVLLRRTITLSIEGRSHHDANVRDAVSVLVRTRD